MRVEKSDQWWRFIKICTEQMNNSPNKGIGGKIPSQVFSPYFDPIVAEALSKEGNLKTQEPYQIQVKKQNKFVKTTKFKIGSYVMLDFASKPPESHVFFRRKYGDMVSNGRSR